MGSGAPGGGWLGDGRQRNMKFHKKRLCAPEVQSRKCTNKKSF